MPQNFNRTRMMIVESGYWCIQE